MIFGFEAPVNNDVTALFTNYLVELGVDLETAIRLGPHLRDAAFLITDAEIAHRFPNSGPAVTLVDNDETKEIMGMLNRVGVTSPGIFKINSL